MVGEDAEGVLEVSGRMKIVLRGRGRTLEGGDRRRGGDGVVGGAGSSMTSKGMDILGVLNADLTGVLGFGGGDCVAAADCFSSGTFEFAVDGTTAFFGRPRGFVVGL